jgi:hypothetical protein
MADFWDSEGAEWHETEGGSYVRIDGAGAATVFKRAGGWRGVSNIFATVRFTRRPRDTPEAAAELLIEAEAEGESSALWSPPRTTEWTASKPKSGRPGFWRTCAGTILAVRQCPPRGGYPPSWVAYINAAEPVLNASGKPWFSDAESAMMECEAECDRRASTSGQWR